MSTLELFFDLVFVFAITQVTGVVGHESTAAALGRGVLVFAVLWWAWGAYVVAHQHRRHRCAARPPRRHGGRARRPRHRPGGADGVGRRRNGLRPRLPRRDAAAPGPVRPRRREPRLDPAGHRPARPHQPRRRGGAAGGGPGGRRCPGGPVGAGRGDRLRRAVPHRRRGLHRPPVALRRAPRPDRDHRPRRVDRRHRGLRRRHLGRLVARRHRVGGDGARRRPVVGLLHPRRRGRRERALLAAEGHERARLARDVYSYLHVPLVLGIVLAAVGIHEVLVHSAEPLDPVVAGGLLRGRGALLRGPGGHPVPAG